MDTLNQTVETSYPRKSSPLGAIAVGVIFIVIAVSAWISWPGNGVIPTNGPFSTPIIYSYRDPGNFGFTLVYDPSFVKVNPATEFQYIPPCGVNQGSNPIICLRYPSEKFSGTNFSGAYAYATMDPCGKIQGEPRGSERLGGVSFEGYNTGDAGLGHAATGKVWRYTISTGNCLSIGYQIHTTNFGNYPEGSIKEFTQADYSEVESALLKFINSYQQTTNP